MRERASERASERARERVSERASECFHAPVSVNVCNDFLGNENLLFQITENIVYNNYNMNHFDLI